MLIVALMNPMGNEERQASRPARAIRFGPFELDLRAAELRKGAARIRLQTQPFQILVALLEHAGEVVLREEIRTMLWPDNTVVEFDHSINAAVKRLRDVLLDSADRPRYIETVAKRGYRFIGEVETASNRVSNPLQAESAESPLPSTSVAQYAPIPKLDIPLKAPPPIRQAPPPEVSSPSLEPPPPPITARKSRTGLIAAVCAAVLVLGAPAGWWLFQHSTAGSKSVQLTPFPLTAAQGMEFGASFSPDGNEVAYSWDGGDGKGFFHVYVKTIGSGKPLRLTTSATRDIFPAWSPDGRSIAFVRYLDRTCQVYVVPALGGAETKVIEGFLCSPNSWRPLDLPAPAWSPDGKFLGIPVSTSSDSHQTSLFLVRVENGERLRLTTPPDAEAADFSPVFSPDGRVLLFTRRLGDARCALYLLNLAQGYRPVGEPTLLGKKTDEPSGFTGVAWTADGSAVIYSFKVGRNRHLMRVQAKAGAEPERLMFAGDRAEYPATAPRANRLAYTQVLSETHIWQIEPGKPVRTFSASTRVDYAPQYSPDGRRVVFASSRSGLLPDMDVRGGWRGSSTVDTLRRDGSRLTTLVAGRTVDRLRSSLGGGISSFCDVRRWGPNPPINYRAGRRSQTELVP